MKVLVTGHDGFVGKHFSQEMPIVPLNEEGEERVDLRDATGISQAVSRIRPEAVVHLASQSFVPQSFQNPSETFEINFFGTFNLLTALKREEFRGTFLFVGSGEEYGQVHESNMPIKEDHVLRPRNPYSVSKVAAEALCYQYSQTEKFKVLMVRPFNHIGPGQDSRFAISDFAKQIIEIKKGMRGTIVNAGDIEVCRDFTDVRDVVKAYKVLLREGKNGEVYNICSGVDWKIRDLINMMLKISGVSADVRIDPERFRNSEQRRIVGSYEKLNRQVDWVPKITMEESLRDILSDWEGRLS